MKDFFKNIQTLLIVALVIIILFMRDCRGGNDPIEPKVITKVEVKWDTLKIDSLVYVPKWKTKIKIIHDTIPSDVDTLSILKDYYTKYFYTDTLNLDSLGSIIINDTISKNSILSRKIQPNVLIPTTTIINTVYINENEFYLGVGLQGKTNQLNYLGGEMLWRSKKRNVYGFGLGVNQDFQPVLSTRMYWRIGK